VAKAAAPEREINPTTSTLEYLVKEYVHLRAEEADISKRKRELRDEIITMVEAEGEFNAQGSQYLYVDHSTGASMVERQRRVSRGTPNMEAAKEILAEKGLEDEAFILVPMLDEEVVMRKVFEGVISDDELDRIYPIKETFALAVT
jgi:hypothetical protein